MSGPERPPELLAPTTKLKRKRFSDQDQEELDKLDSVFKRIKKAVPRAPYILSTPSLHPYQYHSKHEAQAWMMGRMFKPDEEYLQYRTYHFREPYQNCFTLQHGEDDEPEPPKPKSHAANVTGQVPKKKISLSDYKSKKTNGIITPGSKKASPNLPPVEAAQAQTNGVKPSEKQTPPVTRKPKDEAKTLKRPATDALLPAKPDKRARDDRPTAPEVAPPKPESAESKINLDKSGPSSSTPHGLPPLLSPVDQDLGIPYGLPALLSPTLPSSIQVELEKLETQRNRADSNTSSSSSDRKSQLLSVPDVGTPKRNDGSSSASVERPVPLNVASPRPGPAHVAEESKQRLIVKLRYTKKSRETIKRLLNLPPKGEGIGGKKERAGTPKDCSVQAPSKVTDGLVAKPKPIPKVAARRPESTTPGSKASVAATKAPEKRPRTEDSASQSLPSKRARAQPIQDAPNTPKEQTLSSPSLSHKSSAAKGQGPYTTPRKDHKAINMLRANSTESYDSTPGRSGVTPTSSSKYLDVKAPTSIPPSSKKQMDATFLLQTSMKLNMMGRSLKHEGQKLEKDRGDKISKADHKRAAVIGLECILSYMAAYHAGDLALHLRNRPIEVEGTWKTLLPLCESYSRLTKDNQHLDGFRCYLGAVIAADICTLLTPRAPNTKAHDSPHDLPQPELAKQNTQLVENFGMFSKHYLKLLHHMQDARIALPMEGLQKQYPKTWAGAETNAKLAKASENLNGAKFSGPYFLPIQNDTTPIQAVRFGLKFLQEFCEKEHIDHSIRINLDRPE